MQRPWKHDGNRRPMAHTAALLLVAVVLVGCATVGPDYSPPAMKAPPTWQADGGDRWNESPPPPQSLARWWDTLGDPVLTRLVQEALSGNLDLKSAEARIREARALRGIQRASLFPSVDGSATALRQRTSQNGTAGSGVETDFYQAGFDAGWELDLFGGNRRALEAAQADWEAAQAFRNEVQASLAAEVARNYVELRTYQERLALARTNIGIQKATYELNLSRFQAGLIDELPLQQSLYNLEHTRSQVPTLQAGLQASKNRLAVLLGKAPGKLDSLLSQRAPIPAAPPSLAVGIPAEALRRRPDVRRAERELAAATARVGEATADLYPKLRLVGTIGLESLLSGNLLEWASRFWSVGPAAAWKIFDAGAIRKTIQVRNAQQEQALLNYEATVLKALEEVENALTTYAKEEQRLERLEKAVEAARKAEAAARDRYQAGLVDFTDVLDTQRTLQSFQDEMAQSRGAAITNLIRLYKALGGGWTPEPAPSGEEAVRK
ncbi:efflux transporter, outer membrane factor (OMF) lipoprotein, NodT family [Desulfacinum hydrothermale DSM 13146]|uniref:Efflux transporter, outer membrane factor (OMF) lipoprotein, NodT family n=2 Tax=Desulfacinum hydrothermale TaxID=109258 RepID=A0A1W1XNP7_9BACT|nr:efflux transporter, outer membrane factor (OMF) lipoprotein, NodT family [Desulfacinum hydrothermale DSM 13146]